MAENKSSAQHLASLDLEISGILESLKKADEQIQEYGKAAGKNFNSAFSEGLGDSSGKTQSVLDSGSIKNAVQGVSNLTEGYKDLVKTVQELDSAGNLLSGKNTFVSDNNVQTVVKYNAALEETGRTITQNIQSRKEQEDAAWAEYEKQEKERLNIIEQQRKAWEQYDKAVQAAEKRTASETERQIAAYEKQLAAEEKLKQSQIGSSYSDYDKQEQERLNIIEQERKAWEQYYKERESGQSRVEAQTKEEIKWYGEQVKQVDQAVSQLDKMIKKQKEFNATVSAQKTSTANRKIIEDNTDLINVLENLKKQIQETGSVSEQQKAQISDYASEINDLSDYYENAGTKGESFLEKVSDKAKWLAAFYVVNELKNGFFETIGIIKETEDAVVDLQRVLNDDSISQSKMSAELYDVAYEYGRTFDEVAEVSTQFAQAGYDWADTMELTRGTMLALNTAELDVTQSTEGLIAILAQWNLTAEDYADVIDKINITADNFAVTSETIVAALQRSSSSAKNANISLEETISIITALAKATGRSGENIGTALNSLIVYTSKTDALEKFAKVGSDKMKELVADYQAGAASIFDVWKQLSEEVENLSQQQQEVLFQDEDFQELATELQSALGDVYGAAGTYRQNYFIALLNDMETVQDSMKNMEEYAGYSARENEKYMESLTASWNQLKAALAELAVQLGDAGLLDFLKFLTETATAAVKLTQSLGGVLPILTTIIGLFGVVKQQKISSALTEVEVAFELVGGAIKDTLSEASKAPGIMGKLNVVINALSGSSVNLVSALGLVGTAIGLVTSAYNYFTAEAERTNQALLESSKASLEAANSIDELKEKYIQIMDSTASEAEKDEQLAELKDMLLTKYGLEKEALDKLNESREAGLALLKEESKQDITEAYSKIASQYKKAREELESTSFGFSVSSEIDQNTLDILERYGVVVNQILGAGGRQTFGFEIQGESIKEQLENLNAANAALQANGVILPQLEAKIKDLNKVVEENAEAYDQGTEAFSKYLVKVDAAFTELRDNVSDIDSFIEYRQALVAAAEGNSDLIRTMDILLSQQFPEFMSSSSDAEDSANDFSLSIDSLTEGITTLSENIQSLSEDLSSFQSAYATVTAALEEYNQNGVMSLNTIQSIINLGPEYIAMLETVDGKLRLNEEALEVLINAQRENVVQMLQQGLAADTLELANEYLQKATEETAEAQADATEESESLEASLSSLAGAYFEAAAGAVTYGEAAAGILGDDSLGEDFKKRADELAETYKNIYDQVISVGADREYWTGASSAVEKTTSAAKSAEDEIDNLIDKLNDLRRQREEAAVSLTSDKAIQDNQTLLNQIYALISGLQDGTVSAEEASAALEGFDDVVSQIKIEESTYKKLVSEQETLAKDQLELQDMVLQRQKERLEAEKEAIEERYDYEEERVDELSESLEEIQSLMDYSRSRQSLLREISNAESRVGVEYREAERDAREELQQLEEDRILTSVEAFLDKVTEKSNKDRERQINKLDEDIKAIDDRLDDLADIKSLLSNSIADLYNRFGGDLSDISEKVGNVDDFLSSIGYIVQTDESAAPVQDTQAQGLSAVQSVDVESAIYDIAKTSLSSISDMVYEGLDIQDSASQEMFTAMSAMFIQSASSAISVAISQGMSSMSAIIGASVASAIASGGSTTNSTTNYNTTNLVGNIASTAGTMTGQALWDFAMSYFTKP